MRKPTNSEFLQHQTIVDSADPFFTDFLQTKTSDELMTIFERIQKEYDVIMQGESDSAKRSAKERLMVVSSFIELKRLYKELDRFKQGKDNTTDGVSIA